MVIIIDGSNLVHRSYHVFETFTNSKDYPTGAIYGFFSILLSYISRLRTNKVIICWDSRRDDLWRKKLYPEYKSTRKEKDKAISFAFNDIYDLSSFTGLVQIKSFGYEADDIISFLTRRLGSSLRIISGDKDLLQLVNDQNDIQVLRPHPREGLVKYDENKVQERFGVKANDIPLFLSIQGDKSDNIIGLPNYGVKKSAKIINKNDDPIGTIKKMYPNFEEQLKLNLRLIDLNNDYRMVNINSSDILVPKPNLYKLNLKLFSFEIQAFSSKELIEIIYNSKFQYDIFNTLTEQIKLSRS